MVGNIHIDFPGSGQPGYDSAPTESAEDCGLQRSSSRRPLLHYSLV